MLLRTPHEARLRPLRAPPVLVVLLSLIACGDSAEQASPEAPPPESSAPATTPNIAPPAPGVDVPPPAAGVDVPPPAAPVPVTGGEREGEPDPELESMREGVRAFSKNSVGLCTADGKRCGEYLGFDAELTAPGDYLVWAELTVPKIEPEGGWKVAFSTDCTLTTTTSGGTNTATRSHSKTYSVAPSGTAHGYRMALWTIRSPEPGPTTRSCTWLLRAPNPDGAGQEWGGTWSIPAGG